MNKASADTSYISNTNFYEEEKILLPHSDGPLEKIFMKQ